MIPSEPSVGGGDASGGVPRLAVYLSGGGRTLLNLHDEILAGRLRATIKLVVASRQCAGAERARARGLRTMVIQGVIPRGDNAALLRECGIDWVILAGYLKLFQIPPAYAGRVVNIHPALLPKFGGPGMYGHHVHEAVLRAGETESGCTVHLCDDEFDRGRILLQRRCPVLPGDTPDTLAARVFACETEAYPQALRELFESGAPNRPGVKP